MVCGTIGTVPHPNIYLQVPLPQSVARPTADPGVASTILAGSHSFREIDHDQELIFMVILLFRLIQKWLLSFTSESMCTKF